MCTAKFEVGATTSTTVSGGNGGPVSTTTTSQVTTTTTTTAPPTTTTTAPPTTTTTAPPTTTTPPTTTPATYDGQGFWWGWGRQRLSYRRWEARIAVVALDSSGRGARNVDIVLNWTDSEGNTGTTSCNTANHGICVASQVVSNNVQYVDFRIATIDGLPLASPPDPQRVLSP